MRKIVETTQAPAPIGNYSQAVVAGNTIYFAGQVPLNPETGNLVEGDATAQLTQIFNNIKAVAEAAHASLDDVVKLTVYVTDLAMMPTVNEVIAKFFKKPYPARTSIQAAALPGGATVEVEAIAVKGSS